MQVLIALIGIAAAGRAAFSSINAHLAKSRKIQPLKIIRPAGLLLLCQSVTPFMRIYGIFLSLTLCYPALQDLQPREGDDHVTIVSHDRHDSV